MPTLIDLHLTTAEDAINVGVAVIVAGVLFVAVIAVVAAVESRRQRARLAAWIAGRPERTWQQIRAADFADDADEDGHLARAWGLVCEIIDLPAHRLRADDRFADLTRLLITEFEVFSPFEDLDHELSHLDRAVEIATVGEAVRAIAARERVSPEMAARSSSFSTP